MWFKDRFKKSLALKTQKVSTLPHTILLFTSSIHLCCVICCIYNHYVLLLAIFLIVVYTSSYKWLQLKCFLQHLFFTWLIVNLHFANDNGLNLCSVGNPFLLLDDNCNDTTTYCYLFIMMIFSAIISNIFLLHLYRLFSYAYIVTCCLINRFLLLAF